MCANKNTNISTDTKKKFSNHVLDATFFLISKMQWYKIKVFQTKLEIHWNELLNQVINSFRMAWIYIEMDGTVGN